MQVNNLRKLPRFIGFLIILTFVGCSTAQTPTPTAVPIIPTAVVADPAVTAVVFSTVEPTATDTPPTNTPVPTPLPPTPLPTDEPTAVPTETPIPPTETPEPTITPTPELSGFFVAAERSASVYREADLAAAESGIVVEPGEQIKVVGISPNWYWLLAEHQTGTVGWVASDRFNLEDVSLFKLPVTEYRDGDSRDVIVGVVEAGASTGESTTEDSPDSPPPPEPNGDILFETSALRDAALFAEPSVEPGRTGYYVPTGDAAGVIGRSADNLWLHVVATRSGREGWVSADYLDIDPTTISDLQVSEHVGKADLSIINATETPVPTPTPWPTSPPTATIIWPTHTPTIPWPTNTPTPDWPTRTPTPNWPTKTPAPAQPVSTPVPEVPEVPVPVVTEAPAEPAATVDAAATVDPAVTEAPAPEETVEGAEPTAEAAAPTEDAGPPTETPIPTETPTPAPTPIPTTDAVATWSAVAESTVAGFGGWDSAILVAVPSGSTYVFEVEYSRSTSLFDRDGGVDTYFVTLSGMPCGVNVSAELLALQNGFKMQVKNQAGAPGNVMITAPC